MNYERQKEGNARMKMAEKNITNRSLSVLPKEQELIPEY